MVLQRLHLAAVVAGLMLFSGCSGSTAERPATHQSEKPMVYEAVPSPTDDADAPNADNESKATIELRGCAFYREKRALKMEDEAALLSVLDDRRSFRPHSGDKKCEGFHPDFAVRWSVGGRRYVGLLAFACSEFLVYGPEGETRYDIPAETRERLKNLLSPDRHNQPPDAAAGTRADQDRAVPDSHS